MLLFLNPETSISSEQVLLIYTTKRFSYNIIGGRVAMYPTAVYRCVYHPFTEVNDLCNVIRALRFHHLYTTALVVLHTDIATILCTAPAASCALYYIACPQAFEGEPGLRLTSPQAQ